MPEWAVRVGGVTSIQNLCAGTYMLTELAFSIGLC